jgi:hypothetical protein
MLRRTPNLGLLFAVAVNLAAIGCQNDPWIAAGEDAEAQAQSAVLAERDPMRIVHFADSVLDLDSAALSIKLEAMAPRHPLIFEPNWRETLPPYLLDEGVRQLWVDAQKVRTGTADFDRRVRQMLDRVDGLQGQPTGLRIYTYVSRAEEYDVIQADGALFVAWDRFLGADHPLYAQEATYLRARHHPERIYAALAAALYAPASNGGGQLIDEMLRTGKQLLFIQTVLSEADAYRYLTYTSAQQEFAASNERELWETMVRQRWLYDRSLDLKRKLVEVAPFSKLGSERDQEVPGQIGAWLGWRVMQAYWKAHPELSLWEVLESSPSSAELIQQSNYRP